MQVSAVHRSPKMKETGRPINRCIPRKLTDCLKLTMQIKAAHKCCTQNDQNRPIHWLFGCKNVNKLFFYVLHILLIYLKIFSILLLRLFFAWKNCDSPSARSGWRCVQAGPGGVWKMWPLHRFMHKGLNPALGKRNYLSKSSLPQERNNISWILETDGDKHRSSRYNEEDYSGRFSY